MAKKKVFVGLDYDHDKDYQNLLRAWSENPSFEFTFNETSPKVAVDSDEAATIKRVLSRMIGDATSLLCIVGLYTAESEWVDWEINKAKELKKKLVGVKIRKEHESPSALLGSGAPWAMSFTQDSILDALSEA